MKKIWKLEDDWRSTGQQQLVWPKAYRPTLAEILKAKKEVFKNIPYSQLTIDQSGYDGEERVELRKFNNYFDQEVKQR